MVWLKSPRLFPREGHRDRQDGAGSQVFHALDDATLRDIVLNGLLVCRLPAVAVVGNGEQRRRLGAIRDWAFVRLALGVGGLEAPEVLLNVTIPLWVVRETDASLVIVPVLFSMNTVLVVLLQVHTSRRFDSVRSA